MIPARVLEEDDFINRRLTCDEWKSFVDGGGDGDISASSHWIQSMDTRATKASIFSHIKLDLVVKSFPRKGYGQGLTDVLGCALVFDMLAETKERSDRDLFVTPVAYHVADYRVSIVLIKCNLTLLSFLRGDVSWESLVGITCQVARATTLLVRAGLVHNDIYARNVLFDDSEYGSGAIVIIDYGLVDIVDQSRIKRTRHLTILNLDGPEDDMVVFDTGEAGLLSFPMQTSVPACPETSDLFSFFTSVLCQTQPRTLEQVSGVIACILKPCFLSETESVSADLVSSQGDERDEKTRLSAVTSFEWVELHSTYNSEFSNIAQFEFMWLKHADPVIHSVWERLDKYRLEISVSCE
jgi:hypothetical protein